MSDFYIEVHMKALEYKERGVQKSLTIRLGFHRGVSDGWYNLEHNLTETKDTQWHKGFVTCYLPGTPELLKKLQANVDDPTLLEAAQSCYNATGISVTTVKALVEWAEERL